MHRTKAPSAASEARNCLESGPGEALPGGGPRRRLRTHLDAGAAYRHTPQRFAALLWTDVDLEARTITVARAWANVSGHDLLARSAEEWRRQMAQAGFSISYRRHFILEILVDQPGFEPLTC